MSIIYEALKKGEREGGKFTGFGSFFEKPHFFPNHLRIKTIFMLVLAGITLALGLFYLLMGTDLPYLVKPIETRFSETHTATGSSPQSPHPTGSLQTGDRTGESSSPGWEDLFSQALSLEDKGLSDKAIELYVRIKNLKPGYVPAYMSLGRLYYRKGLYEKAIEVYTQAIALSPYNSRAYNNRGTAYLKKGLNHLAVSEYKKALELDGNYSMAYYNLSSVYAGGERKENHDLALAYLEKAIAYNPEARKWARSDPDFSRIKNDQRFKSLIE